MCNLSANVIQVIMVFSNLSVQNVSTKIKSSLKKEDLIFSNQKNKVHFSQKFSQLLIITLLTFIGFEIFKNKENCFRSYAKVPAYFIDFECVKKGNPFYNLTVWQAYLTYKFTENSFTTYW